MHRKVVTVVFCDVVGSTALGESVDPEALQALLARYFERMKGIVAAHGGSVEKFIGDAVMAVFGVPAVHEDDALRAVRAAAAMRAAFEELGVQGRIGVNTGEVITGTDERLATGDAINVAARLQQAAAPNEVLMGEVTEQLVRGAVESERLAPLEVKGKAEPVCGHRLLAVTHAPHRLHDTPFVGRGRELAQLRAAWERTISEERCELVTIVGDPGVGKSRLVAEALAGVGAKAVLARCLPYGEGITYWPLVEIVKQLGAPPSDPHAAAAIRSLLGETDELADPEDIAWAFRKLLAEHAPVAVVIDDAQWGEDRFLDLVEGVGLLSAGAPIFVVCIARPELLVRRAEWSASTRLEPLPDDDVSALLRDVPDGLRDRIAAAAGGNPLFVTEMLAMAEGGGDVEVPRTLRALLAARLDQLDDPERSVLERGAVEGETFHRGAVQALAPEQTEVTPPLAALVRRQLIRPDRAQIAGEEGFRFRHLLVRDAAYEALPKSARADLHMRFADWLETHGSGLVELDEILGYHLEQAALYRAELGQPDATLALRAAKRLAAAGQRTLRPGEELSARPFFARAAELTRPFHVDVSLEIDLALTYHYEDPARAADMCEAAAERARVAGDRPREALALTCAELHRMFLGPEPDVERLESLALAARPLLEADGDHAGLAQLWVTLGYGVANPRGQMADWAHAAEQAIRHARVAGRSQDDYGLAVALIMGPLPADEALHALEGLGGDAPSSSLLLKRAYLLAALGRFGDAWRIALPAAERAREARGGIANDWPAQIAALAGDYEQAVELGSEHVRAFRELGHVIFEASYGARLARWLCFLGRYDEAETLASFSRTVDDQEAACQARQAQARVFAARGDHEAGDRLAREAIAILERTDQLTWQGDAQWDLAEVLLAAGRTDEAAEALEQALDRYERKKNLAMAAQARARLDALRAPTGTG